MKIFTQIPEMRGYSRAARQQGRTIGLVPTMGFLHKGHLSLVDLAREKCDVVVVSNYVNPTQFSVNEDFDAYPVQKEQDRRKLEEAGCDVVFEPVSLYGRDDASFLAGQKERSHQTFVVVEKLETPLCGVSRPHFFRGVATVVAKLLNIVEPDVAVFGQKDYQQLQIIKTMVRELNFGVQIIESPIVREKDGVAMSSRNALLSEDARSDCSVIYRSLKWAKAELETSSFLTLSEIISEISARISESHGEVDYVEIVDADTLQRVETLQRGSSILIAVAAFFKNKQCLSRVRLIDNMRIDLRN